MIGTYAAALAVSAISLAIGQAALALCGARRWSWLAPAVGLALVCAIAWATVRLPGEGVAAAVALIALALAAAAFLWTRVEGGGGALRAGLPVGIAALAAASLPFAVEGHFGILGTGFNPDMSQHLLAADGLAGGSDAQLREQGYPLGPHAVAAALHQGLGIGLVQAFSGLTVAVAVLAPLAALAAFAEQPPIRRSAAALLVGLPYLVASYFAQGAFKETMQALFVLAFVLALRESGRPEWRRLPLRYVPAAAIAIGSVYAYSFPGLTWLVLTAALCVAIALVAPAGGAVAGDPHSGGRGASEHMGVAAATGPAGLAAIVFAVGALPELGRMLDFHRFETFDPAGPGLGNLFGQVSPFAALGIWPSGDFRLAPGDGAVPTLAFYLGAAFATALLLHGLHRLRQRHEAAILAGLGAVAGIYLAARIGGTPYTTAKALEITAPLLTLAIVLSLARYSRAPWREGQTYSDFRAKRERNHAHGPAAVWLVLSVYAAAAAACSLLAFANAPVGPTSHSPALAELRPLLAPHPTLVLAPDRLLEREHGERYLAWELRGGRVCVAAGSAAGEAPPPGVRFVLAFEAEAGRAAPYPGLVLRRRAGPYLVWERPGVVGGPSPCPRIAVREARRGP